MTLVQKSETVKKVELSGLQVDAKECESCGEVKQLYRYHLKGTPYDEFISKCTDCYWWDNLRSTRRKPSKFDDQIVFMGGKPLKRCRVCCSYKEPKYFSADRKSVLGVRQRCKDCDSVAHQKRDKEKLRRYRVEYYRKNKQKLDERSVKWAENNREKYLETRRRRQKRRTQRLAKLPNTTSEEDEFVILRKFDNRCPLTGSSDIQLDHFIPINWEIVGTDKSNLIPIDSKLNILKGAKNPFEWSKEMISEGVFSKEDWLKVVSYLAKLNDMSEEDYEEFVYTCEYFKEG